MWMGRNVDRLELNGPPKGTLGHDWTEGTPSPTPSSLTRGALHIPARTTSALIWSGLDEVDGLDLTPLRGTKLRSSPLRTSSIYWRFIFIFRCTVLCLFRARRAIEPQPILSASVSVGQQPTDRTALDLNVLIILRWLSSKVGQETQKGESKSVCW